MNFDHYLPDTEKRIERLRRVINRRPIAILLPGGSLIELEERIGELKDYDICYASLNHLKPIESVLGKIGKPLSVYMNSAGPGVQLTAIAEFLDRKDDNIFISERRSFDLDFEAYNPAVPRVPPDFVFDEFYQHLNRKFLFFISMPLIDGLYLGAPNEQYPLHFWASTSLAVLLSFVIIGGAPKVFIFGADGGPIDNRELYFYEEANQGIAPCGLRLVDALLRDTKMANETMPSLLNKIYQLYNLNPIEIFNSSMSSRYTAFTKLSYTKSLNLLKNSAIIE